METTLKQTQVQTMLLEQCPPELLTQNVFTDLSLNLVGKVKQWRFRLMEGLTQQVGYTVSQYSSRKGATEEINACKDFMLQQRFESAQLMRTTVMFALMLIFRSSRGKKENDEDPTGHLLLALADSIMGQQYTQNWLIDKKNRSLRKDNSEIVKQLREYRDSTIMNLIHNMNIEAEKKEEIEKIYKRMNYDLVQKGQVFDGLLLRAEHYEASIIELLYYDIDDEKYDKLGEEDRATVLRLSYEQHNIRIQSQLWKDTAQCIKVEGISPYVIKETLLELSSLHPERAVVKDWFESGDIRNLRYGYIDSEYWKGLISIMNVYAPQYDEVLDVLNVLFDYYGHGAQARNDMSDYLGPEFHRNGRSKDSGDIHADHRNKIVTEIVYALFELVQKGEDTAVWQKIKDISLYLGKEMFTLPTDLKGKSLEDLFSLSPESLKEYFMSTGLFLRMIQKNISTWTTGVEGLHRYIQKVEKNNALLEELDMSSKEDLEKLIGLRLISVLTDPTKTPENVVLAELEKRLGLGNKTLYKKLLGYTVTGGMYSIKPNMLHKNLSPISPFIDLPGVIFEYIHLPTVEQINMLISKIDENSSSGKSITECRTIIDRLLWRSSELSKEGREIVMYCDTLLKGKIVKEGFTPISELGGLSTSITAIVNSISTGRIQESVVEGNGHIEEQFASIYNTLIQLPDINSIGKQYNNDILKLIASSIPKCTTKERIFLDSIKRYLKGNADSSYTKKDLICDFLGWVGSYNTLMMTIQNITATHPKYVEYLTGFVHTWKTEEKSFKEMIELLDHISMYLRKQDPLGGDLYARHIYALSLLIWLYDNNIYTSGDPLDTFLKRSNPDKKGGDSDGQQIYIDGVITKNYSKFIDRRNPGYPHAVKVMLEKLAYLLSGKSSSSILDIGSGPGNIIEKIHGKLNERAISNVTITGIDKSQKMINLFRQKLGAIENITAQCADMLTLRSFEEYDIVTANLRLHNMGRFEERKRRAVTIMYNALKPGGTLLLTDIYYNDNRESGRKICIRSFEAHKKEIEALGEGLEYTEILSNIVEKVFGADINGGGLVSREEMKELLQKAGFVDIEILATTDTDILVISAKKPC